MNTKRAGRIDLLFSSRHNLAIYNLAAFAEVFRALAHCPQESAQGYIQHHHQREAYRHTHCADVGVLTGL